MVITELKNKLDDEFFKYYNVILINGTWGIGKTYYIKKYLNDMDKIYISLFGVNKLDDIKMAIYYELNKIGAKFNNFINNNKNRNIGISIVNIPIPNIALDLDKIIKKKLKNRKLILLIDDLERKSNNIDTRELLGFIESLSEIDNVKIILISNEKEIKFDKEDYDSFKEKVVNKTYNITQYSDEALSTICNEYINKNSISDIISNKKLFDIILSILPMYKIKNLRTLKKSILFSKIFLKNINNKILKEEDKIELIKICFAIIVEDCDKTYSKNMKEKTLGECILKHYFENEYINGKLGIIESIINIYNDIDSGLYYKNIIDHYIAKYNISPNSKDIFYCSETEVKKRLNDYIDNNIKKINNSISINVWFKELDKLYPWAEKINEKEIFNDDEIVKAIDLYVRNIKTDDNLYNLINRTFPLHLSHPDTKKYYSLIKYKIVLFYYEELICKIKNSIINKEYNVDLITEFLDNMSNSYIIDSETREEIKKILFDNDFFIPDINSDITENEWHWCHIIWEKCSYSSDSEIKNMLYKTSKKISKKYGNIGNYRINSLNEQYQISDK